MELMGIDVKTLIDGIRTDCTNGGHQKVINAMMWTTLIFLLWGSVTTMVTL